MPGIDFTPITTADLVKLIGAVTAFGIGLYQYVKAQKWKRREFIAAQLKKFEADKDIRLVMTMLDWTDRTLYFPSDTGGGPIEVRVDDQLLCSALLPHDEACPFESKEVMIRDRIDRFLEMLVRLENFVEARLISIKELRPYIDYWIRLISGNMGDRRNREVSVLLLNYIKHYGFDGAKRLISQFGYNPDPPKAEIDQAISKAVERRKKSEFHANSGSPAVAHASPPVSS